MRNMKNTKKTLSLMMILMVAFTSVPMFSFAATTEPELVAPKEPVINLDKTKTSLKKNKKDKKYHLTIVLQSKVACTGYTLYKVVNGKEKKLASFGNKKIKLVYKSKKKLTNTDFKLKSYNTYYKYKKGKIVKWVIKKPKKKFWYKKMTNIVYNETKPEQKEEKKEEEKTEEEEPSAGGGGGGGGSFSTGGDGKADSGSGSGGNQDTEIMDNDPKGDITLPAL